MPIDYSRYRIAPDMSMGIQAFQNKQQMDLERESKMAQQEKSAALAGGRWGLVDEEYVFQQPTLKRGSYGIESIPAQEGWEPTNQLGLTASGIGAHEYETYAQRQQAKIDKMAQETAQLQAREEALLAEQTKAKEEQEKNKAIVQQRKTIDTDMYNEYQNVIGSELQLTELDDAMQGVETGNYEVLKAWAGKYMPMVDPSDMQNVQSMATAYALEELSKQGGTKTDLDFLKSAEATFRAGNTTKANKMIMDRLKRKIQFAKDKRQAYQDFQYGGDGRDDLENFSFTVEDWNKAREKRKPKEKKKQSARDRLKEAKERARANQ